MHHLSRSLEQEYRSKNILVFSLLPGFVSTNMTGNLKSSFLMPNARMYVESAMRDIRFRWNGNYSTGYIVHEFLQGLTSFTELIFGESITNEIFSFILNTLGAIFSMGKKETS